MIEPSIKIDHVKKKITFTLVSDAAPIYANEKNLELFKKISDPEIDIDECLTYMSIMFGNILENHNVTR